MRVTLSLTHAESWSQRATDIELRGWSVGLDSGFQDSVLVRPSELASPCPVRRDIWLIRHGRRLSGKAVDKGMSYHEEVLGVFNAVVKDGWDGLRRVLAKGLIRSHAGAWALSVASAWISGGGIPPLTVEPTLPPALGFSRSRPDLVVGFSPTEVAYSASGDSRYIKRKRVEVAAYALIMEALLKVPVDFGWLIVVSDDGVSVQDVFISDGLREKALRWREEISSLISSDVPPEPPRNGCPESCPFRQVCLGSS